MASRPISAEEQIWFFLREHMSLPKFTQKQHNLSDIVEKGLTMKDCLQICDVKGEPSNYAFYIHSDSMAAAVRLLNDQSILATYNLYCREDSVVTISIRDIDELSPNTSRAPSHANSLAERRKVSGRRKVSEIFIQPRVRHASGSLDVFTQEIIEDEETMVTIDAGGEDFVTFTMEYLHGWIKDRLSENIAPTNITAETYSANGNKREIKLTNAVWQRSLLRGNWQKEFSELWENYSQIKVERDRMIADIIRNVPDFKSQCQNFIHDLRTYGGDAGSRKRLDGAGHEFYLGPPYFPDSRTVGSILALPTANGTMQAELDRLKAKRKTEMCASHDLSPLYEAVLGLEWDKVRGKASIEELSLSGLSLGSRMKENTKLMGKKLKDTVGRARGKKGGKKDVSATGGSQAGW